MGNYQHWSYFSKCCAILISLFGMDMWIWICLQRNGYSHLPVYIVKQKEVRVQCHDLVNYSINIYPKYSDTRTCPKISTGPFHSLLLTVVLLNPDMSCLCKQCRSRSVGEANWSGSALFVIQNVNLYQQPGSSNLIGWKLEVSVAS